MGVNLRHETVFAKICETAGAGVIKYYLRSVGKRQVSMRCSIKNKSSAQTVIVAMDDCYQTIADCYVRRAERRVLKYEIVFCRKKQAGWRDR